MNIIKISAVAAFAAIATLSNAQSDVSLFWKKEKKQLPEIVSAEAVQYKTVGHHGPAVENMHMALRLYFNNSGAIDVYSKANPGLELAKYGWYPTKEDIAAGAGCDEYRVGKTIGLGGISLWDGEKEIKPEATRGRTARVSRTRKGAQMQMLSKGIAYKGDTIDILVTVSVNNKKREATVTAECTTGQKVEFFTGVNFHKGQTTKFDSNHIAVWGIHPADVVENPLPIGGGMKFCKKCWSSVKEMKNILAITSKPCKKASTTITAACSRESEINTEEKFFKYVFGL